MNFENDDESGSETQENFQDDFSKKDADADKSMFFEDDDISAFLGASTKKYRKNAKAVECLDLAGNVIGQYRSGIAAVKALGIQQGDISLCCRGMKDSINGYRFRFVGEDDKSRNSRRDGDDDRLVTRLTRNRGDVVIEKGHDKQMSVLAPPEIKVRKWRRVAYSFSRLVVPRWLPDKDTPTEALKDFQTNKKLQKKRRRASGKIGVQDI